LETYAVLLSFILKFFPFKPINLNFYHFGRVEAPLVIYLRILISQIWSYSWCLI